MKKLSCIAVSVAAFAVLLLSSCTSKEATFSDMRARMVRTCIPTEEDMEDVSIESQIASTDKYVDRLLSTLNKAEDRDYLWDEPSCRDSEFSPWAPWSVSTPFERLSTMAIVYKNPYSKYYNNKDLLEEFLSAFDWMCANKWNPQTPIRGNWWEWVIGIPITVNQITAVMYDELTPERRQIITETLDYYAPNCEFPGASTGANKVWQCSIMIDRGILEENEEKIAIGINGLATELKFVESGDGFYRDGSFIQHGAIPYNGGYGISFIHHFANMSLVLRGSRYQLPKEYMDFLEILVTEAYMPLLYNGSIMDMSRGREVIRCGDQVMGKRLLAYIYEVSKSFRPSLRDSIECIVKTDLTEMQDESDPEVKAALSRLNDVSIPVQIKTDLAHIIKDSNISLMTREPFYKQYQMMDRAVYNAGAFAVGLAMSSSRIQNYETLGGENMSAWHTSDGMTYIYNGDRMQYNDSYWYTVDNYRLPGITVDLDQKHPIQSALFNNGKLYVEGYRSPYHWVGGAALSDCGISGMHFKDEHSSLEARKSWLFAGDVMVAFGAGIKSSDGRQIATIVDNRKLTGGKENFSLCYDADDVVGILDLKSNESSKSGNIDCATLVSPYKNGSVGYIFLDDNKVEIRSLSRIGSQSISSLSGDTTQYVKDFVTISLLHGKNPAGASYCYAVLPATSEKEVIERCKCGDIKVLANTEAVQAVQIGKERVIGINFWEGASFKSDALAASSSSAASLILREKGNTLQVSISDPTQIQTDPIRIELNISAKTAMETDGTIKVVNLSPLVIEFAPDGAMGSSHIINLSLDK